VVPIEVPDDETERTALVPYETMHRLVFGQDDESNEERQAA
jgi:hypothetical protein